MPPSTPGTPPPAPLRTTPTTSPSMSSPSSPASSPSDKLCMVCNDRALGYNFNAVTCESCKAFFRRNALAQKTFLCPFNDNCEITVVTRRFCQKCRLDKCFAVGMRKEYIMSEEDKKLKKAKIEQNRTKRKPNAEMCQDDESVGKAKKLKPDSGFGGSDEQETSAHLPTMFPTISSSTGSPDPIKPNHEMPTVDSSSTEIVDRLVNFPEDSNKLINQLMPSPFDAVSVMTKIIHSQKDAMRLIGHLIASPGDALKIISKIMNSPFDALTVFTKFMSSPTDALEIIAKIASSPEEVLQFIQQLMNSPEDALQIMHKFMNSPAEALKMLNQMVNSSGAESMKSQPDDVRQEAEAPMIKSMLSETNIPTMSSPCENAAQPPVAKPHPKETIQSVLNEVNVGDGDPPENAATSLDAMICEAISLEYDLVGKHQAMNRDLNEAERAKLNELIVANKALNAPLDEDLTGLDSCSGDPNQDRPLGGHQDPQLLKIINLAAVAIRRLIKMSKKINAFRNMCQEDQVALLKGGCTEMMILRSAMQFDSDLAKWNVNTRPPKLPNSQESMSSITVDVLKLAKGNVYEVHETFIRTFESKWRQDENIILILSAIVLFTPSRPKTVHTDVLKLEQNSYYYLLRRYLESIYPGCEAKSTFLKLIQKITELQRLSDEIVGVYLDVNPRQVEPLLREIFDLKNH